MILSIQTKQLNSLIIEIKPLTKQCNLVVQFRITTSIFSHLYTTFKKERRTSRCKQL